MREASRPVQAPTKSELVVSLKTAKTLGIEMPPTLLVGGDGDRIELPLLHGVCRLLGTSAT